MDWTDQDSREWSKTWEMPHMQKGLKFVAQGFDLSPVFIKSAGFYEGGQEVIDLIETLGRGQVNKPKFDLPEPFSHITSEETN